MKRGRKSFEIETTQYSEEFGDVTIVACGTISPYYPATMYRANGDPGDPAEGGEVEYDDLTCYDSDGDEVVFEPDFDALDEIATEQAEEDYDCFYDRDE